MIDLPLGKAIVAVEVESMRKHADGVCYECAWYEECHNEGYCHAGNRQDGKNVVFKIVDYPVLPEQIMRSQQEEKKK